MPSTSRPEPELPFIFPPSDSRYWPLAQIPSDGVAQMVLAEMSVGRGLSKLAVLKRIRAGLASDREVVAMFLQEGRLAASLNHRNIVQTYELLGDGRRPIIALEYLEGQPLARVLNRLVGSNTLSWILRLRILANVLAALDYAHELTDLDGAPAGVVHGGVNPQNVWVTYTGQVKLVDFGVAKSQVGSYQARPGLVGKVAYMAPEQLLGAGRQIDRRADLFSVGVMLWEMAAGRRLWMDTTEATIIQYMTANVPIPPIPTTTNPPPGLAAICARALALDPARRYGKASEFLADLDQLIPGSDRSHGRHLGKVVSLAFAEEQAARQAFIERARSAIPNRESDDEHDEHVELETMRRARPTPGAMWTFDGPPTISRSGAVETGANLAVATAMPKGAAGAATLRVLPKASRKAFPHVRAPGLVWGALSAGAAILLVVAVSSALSTARWGKNAANAAAMATGSSPGTRPPSLSARTGSPQAAGAEAPRGGIIIAPIRAPILTDAPAARPASTTSAAPKVGGQRRATDESLAQRRHRKLQDREEMERMWKWLRADARSRASQDGRTAASAPGVHDDDDILAPSLELAPERASTKSTPSRVQNPRRVDLNDLFGP